MTAVELRHDISVHKNSATLPQEPFQPAGWPAGLTARVLRRLETDGSVRSAVVHFPPGWSSAPASCSTTYQCYVLEGDLALGGEKLGPRAFFARKAGKPFAGVSTSGGAQVLMIFDAAPAFRAAEGAAPATVLHRDIVADIKGFQPAVNGTPVAGFERRVLWEDPDTGADTRHLTIGQFEGKGPNWHPVHEEIYCLSGKLGPDDRRILSAGWYLHNPAYGVHGYHEHSHKGATLLEWHDGPWKLTFVEKA